MIDTSVNEWADFWYYTRKVNVIPFDTKNRKKIIESYREFQNLRIPKEVFEQWKKDGLFEKGMAVIPGKIYSDDSREDLYLVGLDFDTKEAIEEFCSYFGQNITINELANITIVEQHLDNPERAHSYLLSPIPFPNKGADSKIKLEVKSRGEHGIMFCSNSPHENGYNYQIIGTTEPLILSKLQALEMIQQINGICKKYGLEYIDKKASKNSHLKKMIKSLKIDQKTDFAINQGERHITLLSIANSILFHHLEKDDKNIEMLKVFFQEINQTFSFPEPLASEEIDSIWNSSLGYVKANKDFDIDMRSKSHNLDNEPRPGLIEDATEMILENHHFLTLEESKEILYYKDGVYVTGGSIIIEKEAEDIFGYKLANNHITEIKGHIIRKTYHKRDDLDVDVNIINLQNGLYNIIENKLSPHTPNYLSVNQKSILYDPNAKPKLFWRFLRDILYPVEIRTAVESMAYTFYRDIPFEYFFKLFGYGSNGKSVFTGLLTKLHDPKNISNVSISTLLENRFALADLEFKDVNIDTELSAAVIKDTAVLKKLTGGRKQPIRIERKNQKAYDTYLHAKLFFNANTIRETIDQTAAYYRREILISFPYTFEGKKDDPYLLQKLSSKEELSGIFNVLMNALRRLLKNNTIYTNEKTIDERRVKSEMASNPVKAFIEDAVTEDSLASDWIQKIDLHNAYLRFCKKHKIASKTIELFGKDIKKMNFEEKRITVSKERKNVWVGIKLRAQYLLTTNQLELDFK